MAFSHRKRGMTYDGVYVSTIKIYMKSAGNTVTDCNTFYAPPFRYREEAEYLSHHPTFRGTYTSKISRIIVIGDSASDNATVLIYNDAEILDQYCVPLKGRCRPKGMKPLKVDKTITKNQ